MEKTLLNRRETSFFSKLANDLVYNQEDLGEFIESMSQKNLDDILEFFKTMPKLSHTVTLTHPKTKKKAKYKLEGMQSFF